MLLFNASHLSGKQLKNRAFSSGDRSKQVNKYKISIILLLNTRYS